MGNVLERDHSVDILRIIGLFAVILAHVSAPNIINNIRCFDVILMVYCMVRSYQLSIRKGELPYKEYVAKRFKRLVLSCWIFLVFYFFMYSLACRFLGFEFEYTLGGIIATFLTGECFGGTWIIRIYFAVALVLPLCSKLFRNKKIMKNNLLVGGAAVLILILVCTLLYNIVYLPINEYMETFLTNLIFNKVIYETFIWILITVGMFLISSCMTDNKRMTGALICSAAILLVYFCIDSDCFQFEQYKYPPQASYIAYGIGMAMLLQIVAAKTGIGNWIHRNLLFVMWFSKESLWIYYWHLFYLSIFRKVLAKIPTINKWWILYIVVIIFSCATTWIMKRILRNVKILRSIL